MNGGTDATQTFIEERRREGFCLCGLLLGLNEAAGAPALSQTCVKHAKLVPLTRDPPS